MAKVVPSDLIRAIGKAPKIGRRRWQEFADALNDNAALARAQAATALPAFASFDSDVRFARALNAANRQEPNKTGVAGALVIKDAAGQFLGQIRSTERDVKVTLAKPSGTAFAQFLTARLPDLVLEFHAFDATKGKSKGS